MQEHEIHTQSHSESLEMMDANAKTPASVGGGVQLDDVSLKTPSLYKSSQIRFCLFLLSFTRKQLSYMPRQ